MSVLWDDSHINHQTKEIKEWKENSTLHSIPVLWDEPTITKATTDTKKEENR